MTYESIFVLPGNRFFGTSGRNGLKIQYAVASFKSGRTLRVPVPGLEWDRESQPWKALSKKVLKVSLLCL